jgi:hypothetical protein
MVFRDMMIFYRLFAQCVQQPIDMVYYLLSGNILMITLTLALQGRGTKEKSLPGLRPLLLVRGGIKGG